MTHYAFSADSCCMQLQLITGDKAYPCTRVFSDLEFQMEHMLKLKQHWYQQARVPTCQSHSVVSIILDTMQTPLFIARLHLLQGTAEAELLFSNATFQQ